MSHPLAPWTLHGHAVQTLHPVDIDRSRPLIPPELEIVSVFPGKTLGGVYLASYGTGSVLQYNELIVFSALVSHAGKVAPWVSHIYVDHPDSIEGGREIWGLPKQMAEFTWQYAASQSLAIVRQEGQTLCTLTYTQPFSLWRQTFSGAGFSTLESNLLLFNAEATLQPGLTSANLVIPERSPFAGLELGNPWLALRADDLRLVVYPPSVVGQQRSQWSRDREPATY